MNQKDIYGLNDLFIELMENMLDNDPDTDNFNIGSYSISPGLIYHDYKVISTALRRTKFSNILNDEEELKDRYSGEINEMKLNKEIDEYDGDFENQMYVIPKEESSEEEETEVPENEEGTRTTFAMNEFMNNDDEEVKERG